MKRETARTARATRPDSDLAADKNLADKNLADKNLADKNLSGENLAVANTPGRLQHFCRIPPFACKIYAWNFGLARTAFLGRVGDREARRKPAAACVR